MPALFASLPKRVVLASGSPRRAELLRQIGVMFTTVVPDVDETVGEGEAPGAYVARVAAAKAERAATLTPLRPVVAADTTVTLEEEDGTTRILTKPRDEAEAAAFLRLLAGRTHRVMTAVCVVSEAGTASDVVTTDVTFAPVTEDDVLAYVATGEPFGKAGGYAIQGMAAVFVARIEGTV